MVSDGDAVDHIPETSTVCANPQKAITNFLSVLIFVRFSTLDFEQPSWPWEL